MKLFLKVSDGHEEGFYQTKDDAQYARFWQNFKLARSADIIWVVSWIKKVAPNQYVVKSLGLRSNRKP